MILNAKNITKYYGKNMALQDFDLTIDEGRIFGLLGANGAGKTTFVKIMLDLVASNSGEILLNGITSKDYRGRLAVAYLPEKFSFYPYYKFGSVLDFYGKMRGIKSYDIKIKKEKALDLFNITELTAKKVSNLSKGQLQRVGLASTFISDASFFILDEPFSGLDPIGIRDLKKMINELGREGKTVMINSHILSEMEQICNEIAIIDRGKKVFQGEISEIKKTDTLEEFFYKMVSHERI